jgi:hypothetical protein
MEYGDDNGADNHQNNVGMQRDRAFRNPEAWDIVTMSAQ